MSHIDLKTINYFEYRDEPLAWSFNGLVLGPINLVVGKNSTGKTRVLNVVAFLAKILRANEHEVHEANYDATFTTDEGELRYILHIEKSKVLMEQVYYRGELKLDRNQETLNIYYEKEGRTISHEPAPNEVSASARKDKHQHPYLMLLHDWARSVRAYAFGSNLGKNNLMLGIKAPANMKIPELDDFDPERVVAIFMKGKKDYGEPFVSALIDDMKSLGYPISDVTDGSPIDMAAMLTAGDQPLPVAGQLKAIGVKEDGIEAVVYQQAMSQGMFRALSILTQVNYSQISKRAHCVVIDDIGEGLDFDRSALLIELLRNKAKASNFQLVMATNDKFVMNHVPLEEWSILQRSGNTVSVRNYQNSKSAFEDFKFVGLSNFAFFEMDFVNSAPSEDVQLTLEGIKGDE